MNQKVKIETYNKLKNGQIKCKKCGASDMKFIEKTGLLKCNYCRSEFSSETINESIDDIANLNGVVIGSASQNIENNADDIITFRCQGCGSEVVIDSNETTQARCHWCRSFLSLNQKVPNGSVPDVVLPFKVTKEEAELTIKEFVNSRKFFAHSNFKKEFSSNNIIGVYFPYMLVDINAHVKFVGQGEHLVKRYTVGSSDNKEVYYDADLYNVVRDFDILIDDLSIESNSDILNFSSSENTTNIINSIMPFDTENCIVWNANYLKGYSSEKRNININQLKPFVDIQAKDIARIAINDTIKNFDRGVAWSVEQLNIKGEKWKTAYLPVWLYSYQQVDKKKKVIHYVAVNARTNEVMGSIPINITKLLLVSLLVEMLCGMYVYFVDFGYSWLSLFGGIVFYLFVYIRYRNHNKRHKHEKETKKKIINLKGSDNFIERRRRLKNSRMQGANNNVVHGSKTQNVLLDSINDVIK